MQKVQFMWFGKCGYLYVILESFSSIMEISILHALPLLDMSCI